MRTADYFHPANGTATLPVEATPRETAPVPLLPERNKRLKARLDMYKVELPPFYPAFDRIFVVPFEDDEVDTTASGLVIPKQYLDKVQGQRGLLIAAGPTAVEQLYAHGIGIGDIVLVARFSVWVQPYLCPKSRTPAVMMVLRASEVVGSLDLMNAYAKGDAWQEMDVAAGTVEFATRDGERKRVDPPENDEGT